MNEIHASVLLDEVVQALKPRPGGRYLDVTCGLGGHTEAILKACGPDGRVLGIDRDPVAIELAQGRLARFGDRVDIVEGSYSEALAYADAAGMLPLDGVVADLGVSSLQLNDAARGFSFMREGPLDMRMGPSVGPGAAELLEGFDVKELSSLLRAFGEVNRNRQVAEAIIQARDAGKLTSTTALAEVIEVALGGRRASAIHPATRAFQAIRIAVNRELEELEALLAALPGMLAPGGVAAVISFHSLEDRIVKRAFAPPVASPQPHRLPVEPVRVQGPWAPGRRKPTTPSQAELAQNPRSRSAKLRVAHRAEAAA